MGDITATKPSKTPWIASHVSSICYWSHNVRIIILLVDRVDLRPCSQIHVIVCSFKAYQQAYGQLSCVNQRTKGTKRDTYLPPVGVPFQISFQPYRHSAYLIRQILHASLIPYASSVFSDGVHQANQSSVVEALCDALAESLSARLGSAAPTIPRRHRYLSNSYAPSDMET